MKLPTPDHCMVYWSTYTSKKKLQQQRFQQWFFNMRSGMDREPVASCTVVICGLLWNPEIALATCYNTLQHVTTCYNMLPVQVCSETVDLRLCSLHLVF